MRPSLFFFAAFAVAAPGSPDSPADDVDVRDLPITREGSALLLAGRPWKAVGANIYWLGLDENVTPPEGEPYYQPLKASYPSKGRITEAMATVQAMGGTAIRAHTLGVSTGNPLSVMPALGEINEQAFDSIDWAVYQARQYGLRLMVPLTDNFDYYHGGKYNFLRWHGVDVNGQKDANNPIIQRFYWNETIIASFKDYIHKLVTHVNQYTNVSYADDPTIFAYETGNELCGPIWGDMAVPASWVQEIGSYVKSLAPKKLFVDGTYGVNRTHLDIPEVDIFSDHYYPISLKKLKDDLDLVASVNKTYYAGEYDWVGAGGSEGDSSLSSWFEALDDSPVAIGSAFWSLFGHNVPDCETFVDHNDGLALQFRNPANSARTTSRIQLIYQHLMRMGQGINVTATATLPTVPCPAPSDGDIPAWPWPVAGTEESGTEESGAEEN